MVKTAMFVEKTTVVSRLDVISHNTISIVAMKSITRRENLYGDYGSEYSFTWHFVVVLNPLLEGYSEQII